MPDATTFALFAAACVAFLVIPGPSVFYIVTRSLVQGRRAGVTSMFGVQAGGLVHVVAAAFGLSALIASSAAAFTVVKYAGAAYLSSSACASCSAASATSPRSRRGPASVSRGCSPGRDRQRAQPEDRAVLPRLPAAVRRPGAGPVAPQMLVLGLMLVSIGVFSDGTYALLAASIGNRLQAPSPPRAHQRRGVREPRRGRRARGRAEAVLG